MPKERIILLVSIVFVAAFARLLPHPANFTPVAALALFAGAYLPRAMAFFIPLAAMLLSDIVIGFHSTIFFVYAGMMLTVAIGMCLQDRITFLTTAGGSMVASVIFFVLTNTGVWLMEGIYTMDAQGFVQCFAAALPFFKHSFLGDLFFVSVLFGLFTLAEKYFPRFRAPVYAA